MLYVLNGISFGMVLFLVASGLTLILGVMGIVNLAHGSFYLVGAYVGLAVIGYLGIGSYLAGVVASALVVGIIGVLTYRLFLIRFYQQHLAQVLLTFGIIFFFADVCLWVWGGAPQILPRPSFLGGSMRVGDSVFPTFRLFLIALGSAVALGLWWFQQRTRIGAVIRAATDDEEMAGGIGINTPFVCSVVFMLGSIIAGVGGVLGGGLLGVYPGIDFEILTYALSVIIIGGLGSIQGAFLASILIGILDNVGRAFFPEAAMFSIFIFMAIFLIVKPEGLLGTK